MPGGSATALLTDLRGSRFRVGEVDVREDDLAATLRKSFGDCSPDPGRRAGHYCSERNASPGFSSSHNT
jgi:hypothetical protein